MATQRINLQLDAHQITLMVERDKEEFYRQAAKLLNKQYQMYSRIRPTASAEQLWVYVALEAAVNLCSDAREKSLEPVAKQINELNNRLSDLLNQPEPNDENSQTMVIEN